MDTQLTRTEIWMEFALAAIKARQSTRNAKLVADQMLASMEYRFKEGAPEAQDEPSAAP